MGRTWTSTTYDKGYRAEGWLGTWLGGTRFYLLAGHDPGAHRDGERDAREQDRKGRPRTEAEEKLQKVVPGRQRNGWRPSKGRTRHYPRTA